ncbi:MAG: hypothetical protein RLZZ319_837 [Actinomycetota bacterium]
MGLTSAISTVFRNYATFRGVAPRSEYWWWALFTAIVTNAITFVEGFVSPDSAHPTMAGTALSFLGLIFALGTLIPSLAVTVRRFHDAGFSGKWLLLYVIPAIAFIMVAGAAIAGIFAMADPNLGTDQKSQVLFALFGVAAVPVLLSFAVGVFTFVITLLPSKSAAAGNKHAK